ncbi:MAG: carboxylesterase family protein [Actinomycetota bacterium]
MRIEDGKPIAEPGCGPVRGALEGDGEVAVFKGIPFAEAERWAPPTPVSPWTDVRDATSDGPIAHQYAVLFDVFMDNLVNGLGLPRWRKRALKAGFKLDRRKQHEDCLSLGVRAPVGAEGLPVMVWIHGGNHTDGSGSDPLYATNVLPEQGCVLVTINYRLGLLGFFAHPELSAESPDRVSGNQGMLDQIAGLRWVRDNIAAFGGDPDNVTIFGESAGGMSVLHLMCSPGARGLFHRAIAQSPSHTGLWLHLRRTALDWDTAENAGRAVADRLVGRGPGQLKRLRALPVEALQELYRTDEELARYFFPLADGVVLPEPPMSVFARGGQADVPLMIGDTAREASLFAADMNPGGSELKGRPVTPFELRQALIRSYGSSIDVDELLAAFPGLGELEPDAVEEHISAHMFGAHVEHVADLHTEAGHSVHRYRFASEPPSKKQTIGAFHAMDVIALFSSPLPLVKWGPGSEELSAEMAERWVSFARDGKPAASGRGDWTAYDPAAPSRYVLDRNGSGMAQVPRSPGVAVMRRRFDRLSAG